MEFRPYDFEKDIESVLRIYREIGWLKNDEVAKEATRAEQACGSGLVALIRGEAECMAMTHEGVMRHGESDLPLCLVSAVTTSHVARQVGYAGRLTAEALARDQVENGSLVAILGIFDQGFYDKLGFGTGSYDHVVAFDPADLLVADVRPRSPIRLGPGDVERIHRARLAYVRGHGSCFIRAAGITHGQMMNQSGGFGLGYEDPDTGELTHHFWAFADDIQGGPYRIAWQCFRTRDEFRELLGLLRGLADQVKLIRMVEGPGVQLQDLLRRPFRGRQISAKGSFEHRNTGIAWWQARIMDLPGCLERTQLPTEESITLNLTLTDPIEGYLCETTRERWSGVGGDWVVTLGPNCKAERSEPRPDLPTMRTSVGTFTRLWLGVNPPTGLALTSADLEASPDLLEQLDRVLLMPKPQPDWDM